MYSDHKGKLQVNHRPLVSSRINFQVKSTFTLRWVALLCSGGCNLNKLIFIFFFFYIFLERESERGEIDLQQKKKKYNLQLTFNYIFFRSFLMVGKKIIKEIKVYLYFIRLNIFVVQELRQMENMENSTANASGRRATMFGNDIASDTSHLKTEVVLLQRKYERLQQKERRMQVFRINS